MLKKQSKAICLAMAIVFCLAFIAVAPPAAMAADMYTVITAPTVGNADDQTLGKIQINIPSTAAFNQTTTYDSVVVSLPDGASFKNFTKAGDDASADVDVKAAPTDSAGLSNPVSPNGCLSVVYKSSRSVEIRVKTSLLGTGSGYTSGAKIDVSFNHVNLQGISGDITAIFTPNGDGAFASGSAVIGKVVSGGGTVAVVSSVKAVGKSDGQKIDTITVMETVKGTIKNGSEIYFKLPSGYTWGGGVSTVFASGSFGLDGQNSGNGGISITGFGTQKLTVKVNANPTGKSAVSLGVDMGNSVGMPLINVPEDATNGDVIVTVSGTGDITEQDVVVAKVGDYSVTVTAGDKTEVYAGLSDQKVAPITVTEAIAGSLIPNRTIKIKLPSGCKWYAEGSIEYLKGGSLLTSNKGTLNSDKDTLTFTVGKTASNTATSFKLKDAKIEVSPSFSGDVIATVSGTAGLTGELTIAHANKLVELTAENVKNIVVGSPNQAVGDIVIKETAKGNIMDTSGANTISLKLDSGYTYASKPVVTVTEGDLSIDSYKLVDNDTTLQITIKSSSTKPSTIKVTGIKVTPMRYVPEGPVKATLSSGKNALDETTLWADADRDGAGDVVIANCATPAPTETEKVGQFNIGSNIYYVNGAAKLMDVAPYVKAGRTYVPVRYLGYALGLTDDQIKWDAATQTVTFTKGSDSVSVVIGSKTLTKNGTATTMDVAPEIKGGRTMLPARWIAEAFGAQVGWNPATQTVLIQSAVK